MAGGNETQLPNPEQLAAAIKMAGGMPGAASPSGLPQMMDGYQMAMPEVPTYSTAYDNLQAEAGPDFSDTRQKIGRALEALGMGLTAGAQGMRGSADPNAPMRDMRERRRAMDLQAAHQARSKTAAERMLQSINPSRDPEIYRLVKYAYDSGQYDQIIPTMQAYHKGALGRLEAQLITQMLQQAGVGGAPQAPQGEEAPGQRPAMSDVMQHGDDKEELF